MKLPRLKTILLIPVILFAVFYVAIAIWVAGIDNVAPAAELPLEPPRTIAIFGASGTAGDGILKAALNDPDVATIHVITRRETPRITAGVEFGKVQMTLHMDYLDYAAIHEQIAGVDSVFWAIGLSSIGVDEETYGMIHVDFPARFVEEWLSVSTRPVISFHYISSSDISEESTAMWVRQKIRAEKTLFALAEGTPLHVVAYRPDYIGPTAEDGHIGQEILYGFFRPLGVAVRAQQIGQAMLEVAARGSDFENGDKLGTFGIHRYSDAWEDRQ